ncbi:DNA polymerase III subunit delta' [Micrococcoides hystricis]|uniref:DNA polymerase III subunit delta n=1 Tax=Micrococcoides hystricis TaxID=1572761 RepID=A0ABV6PAX6_9MICC
MSVDTSHTSTFGVWDALIGQPATFEQLRGEVMRGAPTHAWLFTGPPGSGRSVAARAFAAALVCREERPEDKGCGQCHPCRSILADAHPDVSVYATEEVQYRIEEVREWLELAYRRPATAPWRVIIVEDADRMTERTTNVLLKAIEEPPAHTLWLLCAPSPADVLVTIRSRCRPVRLQIPPVEAITALLVKEGHAPEIAAQAVRLSQAHVGVARWLAEQPAAMQRRLKIAALPLQARSVAAATALAQDLVATTTEEATASSTDRNERELAALKHSMGLAPDENVPPKLRSYFKELEENHKRRNRRALNDALDRAMVDVASFFRDCLSLQLGTGAALVNEELMPNLGNYAAATTPTHALTCIDAITVARERIQSNVPHQLAMEALAVNFVPENRR